VPKPTEFPETICQSTEHTVRYIVTAILKLNAVTIRSLLELNKILFKKLADIEIKE